MGQRLLAGIFGWVLNRKISESVAIPLFAGKEDIETSCIFISFLGLAPSEFYEVYVVSYLREDQLLLLVEIVGGGTWCILSSNVKCRCQKRLSIQFSPSRNS